jgi:hypothetical protein
MAHWIRFVHEGRAAFGVLENDGIKVHSGDMFGGAQPTGATVSLAAVRGESGNSAMSCYFF